MPTDASGLSPWLVLATQVVVTMLVGGGAWYLARQRQTVMRHDRDEAMVASLRLVNKTLPHLRPGLNAETAHQTAHLVHDSFGAAAVAIGSGQEVLAFIGTGADHHVPGQPLQTRIAQEVMRTARPAVARTAQEVGCAVSGCPLYSGVVVPLKSRDRLVGTLAVFHTAPDPLTAGRVRLISELAQLMSLQIELAELDRTTRQLARAQLAALQAQISPHFVYNTLNTIAAFIRTNPDEARRLLTEFAEFTRRSFKSRGEFAPFAQELEFVHQYLGFEKARFGDRLQVVYRVDPEILSTVVPVLVLQPLVENAVRHGVAQREGPVKVIIRAEDHGSECWITVQDEGAGIPPSVVDWLRGERRGRPAAQPTGVGLTNVNDRLRSIYGPEHGLQINSGPSSGTRITFAIPKFKSGVNV